MNHTIIATPPERLQQHPLLFTTNHTDRTFFVWRLNSARPPHPGDSTILLWLEIPSGICAKLRTVAASNNRDHSRNLSYYCLLAAYIMALFFTHIPLVVNHTIIATPPERLQQALGQERRAKIAKIQVHLWHRSQKIQKLQPQNFVSLRTRRLVESFECLISSPVQSVEELWCW